MRRSRRRRRSRKNPIVRFAGANPVGSWTSQHPWMTFFLGLVALSTAGSIVYYLAGGSKRLGA